MFPSSACVSGAGAETGLKLQRQNNAAMESVREHVREMGRGRTRATGENKNVHLKAA